MKNILYLFLAVTMFACSDDEGNPCIYEPTLTTEAVTDITETSATLNGVISIVSENCDVPNNTEQGFVYATEIQPTLEDTQVNVNGTNISTTIEGLTPNTTYYVRAFLTNNFGEFYGDEVSFTTTGDTLLLPKTTEFKVNGITKERHEHSYDDENRLIQVDYWRDNILENKYLYLYTENLTTATEWYENDVLKWVYHYNHNNSGQLISRTLTPYPSEISYRSDDFIYNADGSITHLKYTNEDMIYNIQNLTLLNGQIVNVEQFNADETFFRFYNTSYDDKNSYYKNVGADTYPGKQLNNIIKTEWSGVDPGTTTYTYTYNEDNYPLTKSSSDSPNSITEYTYY